MIHNSFGKEITKSPSWLCFFKQFKLKISKKFSFFLFNKSFLYIFIQNSLIHYIFFGTF